MPAHAHHPLYNAPEGQARSCFSIPHPLLPATTVLRFIMTFGELVGTCRTAPQLICVILTPFSTKNALFVLRRHVQTSRVPCLG